MIYLAYDGSLNGDWVSRYAVHIAREAGAELTVLMVDDHLGATAERMPEQMVVKLARLRHECAVQGVGCHVETLPAPAARVDVAATLTAALAARTPGVLVVGARVRARLRGFLRGSVGHRLLTHPSPATLALRVVQPGLLGHPKKLLVPLSEHAASLENMLPFVRLFMPEATEVHLVRVIPNALQRADATRHLDVALARVDALRVAATTRLDTRVVIASDWPAAVMHQAAELHVGLLLMGATVRTLPSLRFELGLGPLERVLARSPCDVALCAGAPP